MWSPPRHWVSGFQLFPKVVYYLALHAANRVAVFLCVSKFLRRDRPVSSSSLLYTNVSIFYRRRKKKRKEGKYHTTIFASYVFFVICGQPKYSIMFYTGHTDHAETYNLLNSLLSCIALSGWRSYLLLKQQVVLTEFWFLRVIGNPNCCRRPDPVQKSSGL